MNRAAKNSLILIGACSSSFVESQRLLARLIQAAEHAYSIRDLDLLEQLSTRIARYSPDVACYYAGLAAQRLGSGNLEHAKLLLERAAESRSLPYKARALLTLGSVAFYQGRFDAELSFYSEALKLGSQHDLYTYVETSRAIAIRQSIEGDNERALKTLETLYPLVRKLSRSEPCIYYKFLNSLAVELSENGQIEAARKAASTVIASPYAAAHAEWHETAADLRESEKVLIVVPELKKPSKPTRRIVIVFILSHRPAEKLLRLSAEALLSVALIVALIAPIRAPSSLAFP